MFILVLAGCAQTRRRERPQQRRRILAVDQQAAPTRTAVSREAWLATSLLVLISHVPYMHM